MPIPPASVFDPKAPSLYAFCRQTQSFSTRVSRSPAALYLQLMSGAEHLAHGQVRRGQPGDGDCRR
jgi:hypothetical protein